MSKETTTDDDGTQGGRQTRTLGDVLRVARNRAGLSLREAAALATTRGVAISASFLSDFERDRYETLTVDRLVALARLYDTPVDALLRDAGMTPEGDVGGYLDMRAIPDNIRAMIDLLLAVPANCASIEDLRDRMTRVDLRIRYIAGLLTSALARVDLLDDATRDALREIVGSD